MHNELESQQVSQGGFCERSSRVENVWLEKGEFVSDTGFSLLAETLEDYLNTVVR
jgi:hypothetical protein